MSIYDVLTIVVIIVTITILTYPIKWLRGGVYFAGFFTTFWLFLWGYGGTYITNVNQRGATGTVDFTRPISGPMFWITLSFRDHWPVFVGVIVPVFILGCFAGLSEVFRRKGD